MPRIRTAATVAIFITFAVAGSVVAQAQERWFTIELLIFKNGGNAWQREQWDPNPELYYPEPLLISSALSLSSGTGTQMKELEFNGTLAAAADKLTGTGQYRVLYSRRWQQGLVKTKDAPNLLITGGSPRGAHYELEGSIKFSVERYLHVHTNMWFTAFGEPEVRRDTGANTYAEAEKYGAIDAANNEDEDWEELEEDFEEPMVLPAPPWNTDAIGAQESIRRVVTLRQHRRLRSKETHYIDHPSIGILIRIEPVPDTGANSDED